MKKGLVIEIISAMLILLFAYTAFSKMLNYQRSLIMFKLLPFMKPYAEFLAWAVPLSEMVAVLLLFFQRTRLEGLFTSLFLLIIFTAYLTYTLLFPQSLPCNCGGVLNILTWKQHIVFNGCFILLCSIAIIHYPKYIFLKNKAPPG